MITFYIWLQQFITDDHVNIILIVFNIDGFDEETVACLS